jgi:hypothetical protein
VVVVVVVAVGVAIVVVVVVIVVVAVLVVIAAAGAATSPSTTAINRQPSLTRQRAVREKDSECGPTQWAALCPPILTTRTSLIPDPPPPLPCHPMRF